MASSTTSDVHIPGDTRLVDYYTKDGHKAARVNLPVDRVPPLWTPDRGTFMEVLYDKHPNGQKSFWQKGGKEICVFILGGYAGPGTMYDGQMGITRVGSGQELVKGTNTWVQKKDHNWADAYSKAVEGSWTKGSPFLLCSTNKCDYLPVILPSEYDHSVIENSRVTLMWMEKRDNGKYLLKMKYERLDISKPSVFEHPTSPPPKIPIEEQKNLIKANVVTCDHCHRDSPQIYKKQWICLYARKPSDVKGKKGDVDDCPKAISGQEELFDAEKDDFDPRFLADRAPREAHQMREWRAPTPAEDFDVMTHLEKGRISLRAFEIGTTCIYCSCGIQRVNLFCWECKNKDCEGYRVECPLPAIPKRALIERSDMMPFEVPDRDIDAAQPDSVQFLPPFSHGGYLIYPLQLWDLIANSWSETIYVGRPYAETLLDRPNGADAVLRSIMCRIEVNQISLERRPLKTSVVRGQLTGYFTMQAGQHYDYSASHPAENLADLPPEIAQRKNYLAGLVQAITQGDGFPANQIMLNVYMAGHDIGQHGDQNTKGHIVSESLGADGTVFFGYDKKTYLQTEKLDRPGSGSRKEIPMSTLAYFKYQEWVKKGKGKPWEAFQKSLEKSIKSTAIRDVPPIVEIRQTHGSFVAMSSHPFQQRFVHWAATYPKNGPRFNITVRHILKGQKHGGLAVRAAAGQSSGAKTAPDNDTEEKGGLMDREIDVVEISSDEDEDEAQHESWDLEEEEDEAQQENWDSDSE